MSSITSSSSSQGFNPYTHNFQDQNALLKLICNGNLEKLKQFFSGYQGIPSEVFIIKHPSNGKQEDYYLLEYLCDATLCFPSS